MEKGFICIQEFLCALSCYICFLLVEKQISQNEQISIVNALVTTFLPNSKLAMSLCNLSTTKPNGNDYAEFTYPHTCLKYLR